MRPKINIVLAVAAVICILGLSLPETYELALVSDFKGISGDRAIAVSLSSPKSLVNGDIIVRNGQSIIKQRAGFTKFGTTLEGGPIAGICRFDPSAAGEELIAFSGNSLYRYEKNIGDFELLTGSNPVAATCTVTAGSDTVRGISTNWWRMSKYRPQFIRILDGGDDHLIKAILTDTRIILDTAWAGATNNAAACTLQVTYVEGAEDIVDNSVAAKRWLMFMDTLIVVDGTQRFMYRGSGLSAKPVYTVGSVEEGPVFREGWQRISFSGDPIPGFQVGDYVTIENDNVAGTSMRNIWLTTYAYTNGKYYCYSDTAAAVWLNADAAESYTIDRVSKDEDVPTLFFANMVQDVDRDSIADPWHANYYLYKYTIWRTNDATQPHDWPSDTLNWGTYRVTNCWVPHYPVSLTTNGDSVGIVIYDYVYKGNNYKLGTGDTIEIYRMDSVAAVADADTILHDDWAYGIQCLLNNRLYYATDDSSEVWYTKEFTHSGVWGSVFINQDDGDQITCMVPLGRNLIVGKRRHLYQCIISSYDNEPDEIIRIDSPTGIPSQEAVKEFGGIIYFVSPPHGLFAYNGVNVVNISGPAQFYFADSIAENTEPDIRLTVAIDVSIGTPGIYISYTSKSGTENDRTLRLDLETGQWSKYTNFGASCFAILRGGAGYGDTLLFGTPLDGDSYILKFPSGTTDTAEYVNLEYETGFANFGTSLELKRWLEYYPVYTSAAAGSLRVFWYVDWSGTATLVDSFESSAGWQAPQRGLNGVQGKSVGFKIQSKKSTNVEIGSWELYYQDAGRTDD